MENDCFVFVVSSGPCQSENEAWESFKNSARHTFKWVVGTKVWRRAPRLVVNKRVDENTTEYVVIARVISFDGLVEEIEEASIDGPYPQDYDVAGAVSLGISLEPLVKK